MSVTRNRALSCPEAV